MNLSEAYSKIPPMACKCESIEDRNQMIEELKALDVPVIAIYDNVLRLWWGTMIKEPKVFTLKYPDPNDKQVSPSDFLSKFRDVYEASQGYGLVNDPSGTRIIPPLKPVAAKEIVFPSNEEIEKYKMGVLLNKEYGGVNCPVNDICAWYKQRIQELNR